MKRILLSSFMAYLLMTATAQTTYKVSTAKSIVKWSGSNTFKFNEHSGTIKIKKGQVIFKGDSITGGSFEIDMNSMADEEGSSDNGLIHHLKDPDFFDVAKYPVASLEIVKITKREGPDFTVTAKLKIKDVINPVAFTATAKNTNGQRIITSRFIIDRSRWNISYGSGSFFKNVGDEAISDAIKFEVSVVLE